MNPGIALAFLPKREKEWPMTTVANEKIIFTLNDLIMTCKDGQEGFHNAQAVVKDAELKTLFLGYEEQRRQLLAELKPEIVNLRGDPDKGGTMTGAVRRGWLNLKQMINGANDDTVVDEADRSEDIAVESYQMALKEDLPVNVRLIVLRHHNEIKQAHDRISGIKKARKPSA